MSPSELPPRTDPKVARLIDRVRQVRRDRDGERERIEERPRRLLERPDDSPAQVQSLPLAEVVQLRPVSRDDGEPGAAA